MRTQQFILTVLIFFLGIGVLDATHIVGGYMTYQCNAPGSYTITLKVYRDCSSQNTNGTPLDDPANITVYRGDELNIANPLINRGEGLDSQSRIDPGNENPCVIVPPAVCVDEGVYRFNLSLPVSDESYYVVYQRCCRNPETININNARNTGGTYMVEITPESQQLCNSSPTFNNFPPVVICAGLQLNFDHSASDTDGDSLAYEFCAPFQGGGPLTSGPDLSGPNGAIPNPAAPPPYNTVAFRAPTYTANRPMAGNPTITINPITGQILGVPESQGQFSVGVCVKEYRDGELLSETRRDFQFQVTDCELAVFAQIEFDATVGEQQFVVNSCGSNTVNFANESYDATRIQSYEWKFDTGAGTVVVDTRDATITFPNVGEYQGTMIINKGLSCSDTADIFVNIFPEVEADFEFSYDTCVAGPVNFVDLSESDAGPIQSWIWDYKDGNFSNEQNPNYLYGIPGTFPVTLQVIDENECTDTITKLVDYRPAPALLIVEPSSFRGCDPMDVFFSNLSTPIDTTYDIVWDFGDGNTSGVISPRHTYNGVGVYNVSLSVTSPIGCNVSQDFESLISVEPAPDAGFSFNPMAPNRFNPNVSFIDESMDASAWFWDFGDGKFTFERNPSHTFQDTGFFEVMQIVTHLSGCRDTMIQKVDIEPKITYFLPNAFTPNGDDQNDGYRGTGLIDGMTDYKMTIWNRWGELIFESSDPVEAWNGSKNNQGPILQAGVYVCLVQFKDPRGNPKEFKSFATLVK